MADELAEQGLGADERCDLLPGAITKEQAWEQLSDLFYESFTIRHRAVDSLDE